MHPPKRGKLIGTLGSMQGTVLDPRSAWPSRSCFQGLWNQVPHHFLNIHRVARAFWFCGWFLSVFETSVKKNMWSHPQQLGFVPIVSAPGARWDPLVQGRTTAGRWEVQWQGRAGSPPDRHGGIGKTHGFLYRWLMIWCKGDPGTFGFGDDLGVEHCFGWKSAEEFYAKVSEKYHNPLLNQVASRYTVNRLTTYCLFPFTMQVNTTQLWNEHVLDCFWGFP